MADLTRSAKSASAWTLDDLRSYHISLNEVDHLQFFGVQELPQPTVDNQGQSIDPSQQYSPANLIHLLNCSAIDFTVGLFRILRYNYRSRLAFTRPDLPLHICGETRRAKTGVCLTECSNGEDILLVVHGDKKSKRLGPFNVQTQLIAAAIAAFNMNNVERKAVGLPPLTEKVMPGIIMVGTLPVFFKIPITNVLSAHIYSGTYPPEETRVTYCHPPVSRPADRYSEGMKPLDNRQVILRCYEAFRPIIGI